MVMKTLALVRHAKSSWDDPSLSDFDRPLNARGKRDAPFMAHVLQKYGLVDARWISSPANRAYTTAQHMAKVLEKPTASIQTDERLYHAWTDTLLTVIREQKRDLDHLVLFAHNPGLTEMVNRIAPVRLDNLPTCGIFVVTFATEDWSAIEYGSGSFVALDYPKNHQ